MSKTRNIVLSGLMIAIGIVIVFVLKNFGGQPILRMFSPMHLPVMIAGLAIGPIEGLVVGVLTPLLSYLINGLPPAGPWAMMAELGVYGLISGLIMRKCKNAITNDTLRIYVALIVSMIIGRIAGGLVTGFIMSPMANETYSISAWVSAYFVATAPAIVIDLILIPILIKALMKAHLIH